MQPMFAPPLEALVESLTRLPGIGRKGAQRIALHILQRQRSVGEKLAEHLSVALTALQPCKLCRTLSDANPCQICSDPRRDATQLCVVEELADQWALQRATHFNGHYFVLNGRLSPLDGIGPEQLGLPSLAERLSSGAIQVVILATSGTVEGRTTAQWITDVAQQQQITVQRLAQGLPAGSELDYLDNATLSAAFEYRTEQ